MSIKTFYIPKYFSRPFSSSYQFIDHRKYHEISTFNSTQNNFLSSLIDLIAFSFSSLTSVLARRVLMRRRHNPRRETQFD